MLVCQASLIAVAKTLGWRDDAGLCPEPGMRLCAHTDYALRARPHSLLQSILASCPNTFSDAAYYRKAAEKKAVKKAKAKAKSAPKTAAKARRVFLGLTSHGFCVG